MSAERHRRWDPRRLLAGARTRVLLAFVILLALSTIASTLALRQILLARAGERVDDGARPGGGVSSARSPTTGAIR